MAGMERRKWQELAASGLGLAIVGFPCWPLPAVTFSSVTRAESSGMILAVPSAPVVLATDGTPAFGNLLNNLSSANVMG